jgi:hypothetical protein
MAYLAYVLDEASRGVLLSTINFKHSEKIARHVMVRFPVDESTPSPDHRHAIKVVGYASDDKVDCVVVEINGSLKREDGKTFHITLSVDKENGGKPVMSNDLIAKGWTKLEQPFVIYGTLQVVKR